MDNAINFLVCVAVGVVLGAASSLVTRRAGVLAGVAFGAASAGVGLVVIAVVETDVVLPVVGAMIVFSVVASLLDPQPTGSHH